MYPKEENKNQTSEETKIELLIRLKPKQMKLQINRVSKIRNGGIALKVPTDRAEELDQVLKQQFNTRSPKVNRPKLKIFDAPTNLDKEQFTESVYDQNFSESTTYESFQENFIPLFKSGPRDEKFTQWIVEIGKEVRPYT